MDNMVQSPRVEMVLARWRYVAVGTVLALAVLSWVGWATGGGRMTRVFWSWPPMTPWTALLLSGLGVAVLAQSGCPSSGRVWAGRGLAAVAGILAVMFLAEYAVGRSFGLDGVWFSDALLAWPDSFPGRPSMWAASSLLLLSVSVALIRLERRWSGVVWSTCLAAAVVMPIVTALADAFDVVSLMGETGVVTAVGLMLLVAATMITRPDRHPLAWLLARPDWWPLVRMALILAGLPFLVGLSRVVFLTVGVNADSAWVLSTAVGTVFVGAGAFYFGQREQRLLFEKEQLSSQRAEVERERFRAVVGNSPSAISVGDLNNRFTMANDAFCRMFGQESVDAVVGRTEDEILSPDAVERSRRAASRLSQDGDFFEESIEHGRDNIWVMTQRFPLRDSAGARTELVTIRTDITHRKKAEQEEAERARWEERIGTAIDDGRLLVYSHPIVAIGTAETVEEELLVRLRPADDETILPPGEFLPQCERHGLMPVIDRYMVRRAIDLARGGRCVGVNITGQTIGDPTATSEIFQALAAAGPKTANKIVFEITETIALGSPAQTKEFSRGIRGLGCRVALDDFGTGYGTFTELRHLDLDLLKIDQSFVQHMLEDEDDERAVKTIIFVARAYGLSTVAEGVESEAVLERLAELGVDRAQGYLFGEPTPIDTQPGDRKACSAAE
ncbi:MAG: EAL domain-containing protein [Actinomycetia bacterium]|nr:EAL domain-containing protein [Actinomycetes bacterium]MCH9759435.1 EAL domain-containing protein [Actinomycetes bacterium]